MKFLNSHFQWMWPNANDEYAVVFGVATGRVDYTPIARHLYSLRIFVGPMKFEILWTMGENDGHVASVDA